MKKSFITSGTVDSLLGAVTCGETLLYHYDSTRWNGSVTSLSIKNFKVTRSTMDIIAIFFADSKGVVLPIV